MPKPILLIRQDFARDAARNNPDFEIVSWPAGANPALVDWSSLQGREVHISDQGLGSEVAKSVVDACLAAGAALSSISALSPISGDNTGYQRSINSISGAISAGQKSISPGAPGSPSASALVDQFIQQSSGVFTSAELAQWAGFTTREQRVTMHNSLKRRKDKRIIESVNGRNGYWRRIENKCEIIDFLSADAEPVDITLPFGMSDLIEVQPGNIIVVAGEQNAGKTALLLNITRENMIRWDIHYFSSEMGASELRKRLSKFDIPLEAWRFTPKIRADNFQDVIQPGPGKLNIVDYLEVHEDFFKVGGMLKAIHDRLDGAIAIVALQKNQGTDMGLGGARSLEKPRLYLSMEPGKIKIVKAKLWRDERTNPNGLERHFKLAGGCRFVPQGDWCRSIKTAKGKAA